MSRYNLTCAILLVMAAVLLLIGGNLLGVTWKMVCGIVVVVTALVLGATGMAILFMKEEA